MTCIENPPIGHLSVARTILEGMVHGETAHVAGESSREMTSLNLEGG
jgi:hypothetical protein